MKGNGHWKSDGLRPSQIPGHSPSSSGIKISSVSEGKRKEVASYTSFPWGLFTVLPHFVPRGKENFGLVV